MVLDVHTNHLLNDGRKKSYYFPTNYMLDIHKILSGKMLKGRRYLVYKTFENVLPPTPTTHITLMRRFYVAHIPMVRICF